MKKLYFIILFLLISPFGFSQMESYYDDIATEVTTLTGIQLKDVLATKIINTHVNLSYSDIWDACDITDLDPADNTNSNVLLIYGYNDSDGNSSTDLTRSKTLHNSGGSGDGTWNREHVFANSNAVPKLESTGKTGPPYADAHNLRASDVDRNNARGSLEFVTGSGNSKSTNGGWYPGDASMGGVDWRGDVARMTMYMYLRYGTQCLPSYNADGDVNSVDADMIDLLLDWNAADPVSEYEIQRNTYHDSNATYAQGNRNPFIDNPYLATLIWGGTPAEDRWGLFATDNSAPSIPTNLTVSNETSSSVDLNWTASTDNVMVAGYDIYVDNVFNSSSATNSYTVTGLSASTTFSFTVLAKDNSNNKSVQSDAVNGTTLEVSSGGSELFFSEYIEGSSNNKVLEIANITNSAISLSDYSIKLSANGNAGWTTATQLFTNGEEVLANDVFVLENGSNAICTSEADMSSGVTSFNGNDAIGLFKNDVLIDIIGVLGDDNTYASNVTLVRKQTVTQPSTTFDINEWDNYSSDDCTDLGSHSFTLSIEKNTGLSDITIYPNPSNGNTVSINSQETLDVTFFDILGKQILNDRMTNSDNKIDISKLNSGIYFVKLENKLGSTTKKFIKK